MTFAMIFGADELSLSAALFCVKELPRMCRKYFFWNEGMQLKWGLVYHV
jgi:hypothetical protein